jgi:citrate lyase gamma subunit
VERLGRWSENKEIKVNKVCRNFYLGNVSISAVLAFGGHIDGYGKFLYNLDRGNAFDIDVDSLVNDAPVKDILNCIFPGLLDMAIRARDAISRRSHEDSDPVSVTNANVTRCMTMAVAAWIQDSVVLLQNYPSLSTMAPYSHLFNPLIAEQYDNIKSRVNRAITLREKLDLTRIKQTRDVARLMNRFHVRTMESIIDLQEGVADLKDEVVELNERVSKKRKFTLSLQEALDDETAASNLADDRQTAATTGLQDMTTVTPNDHRTSASSESPDMTTVVPNRNNQNALDIEQPFSFQDFKGSKVNHLVDMIREVVHVEESEITVNDKRGLSIRKLLLEAIKKECDNKGMPRNILSYQHIGEQLEHMVTASNGTWDDVRSLVRKGREGPLLDQNILDGIISDRIRKNQEYNRKRRRNEE